MVRSSEYDYIDYDDDYSDDYEDFPDNYDDYDDFDEYDDFDSLAVLKLRVQNIIINDSKLISILNKNFGDIDKSVKEVKKKFASSMYEKKKSGFISDREGSEGGGRGREGGDVIGGEIGDREGRQGSINIGGDKIGGSDNIGGNDNVIGDNIGGDKIGGSDNIGVNDNVIGDNIGDNIGGDKIGGGDKWSGNLIDIGSVNRRPFSGSFRTEKNNVLESDKIDSVGGVGRVDRAGSALDRVDKVDRVGSAHDRADRVESTLDSTLDGSRVDRVGSALDKVDSTLDRSTLDRAGSSTVKRADRSRADRSQLVDMKPYGESKVAIDKLFGNGNIPDSSLTIDDKLLGNGNIPDSSLTIDDKLLGNGNIPDSSLTNDANGKMPDFSLTINANGGLALPLHSSLQHATELGRGVHDPIPSDSRSLFDNSENISQNKSKLSKLLSLSRSNKIDSNDTSDNLSQSTSKLSKLLSLSQLKSTESNDSTTTSDDINQSTSKLKLLSLSRMKSAESIDTIANSDDLGDKKANKPLSKLLSLSRLKKTESNDTSIKSESVTDNKANKLPSNKLLSLSRLKRTESNQSTSEKKGLLGLINLRKNREKNRERIEKETEEKKDDATNTAGKVNIVSVDDFTTNTNSIKSLTSNNTTITITDVPSPSLDSSLLSFNSSSPLFTIPSLKPSNSNSTLQSIFLPFINNLEKIKKSFETKSPDDLISEKQDKAFSNLNQSLKSSLKDGSKQNVSKLVSKDGINSVSEVPVLSGKTVLGGSNKPGKSKANNNEEVTQTLSNLKINDKSTSNKLSTKPFKQVDILSELASNPTYQKPHISFITIGHVDAGKSTLMGRILYDSKIINTKTLNKLIKDSESIGKGSFAFAWIMDQTSEERSRGVTIDICATDFETNSTRFTAIDAPGHKDFVPQLIGGVSKANVAVLIIDSTEGEFESGFNLDGQTKEHTILAKHLGIEKIVIAINKLDKNNWNEIRFNFIKDELLEFLLKVGFNDNQIDFIPISGLTGNNVVKRDDSIDSFNWYKGPSLISYLENIKLKSKSKDLIINQDFLLSVHDSYKDSGLIKINGKIISGLIQSGETILISPVQEVLQIQSIKLGKNQVDFAIEGDLVTFSFKISQLSNNLIEGFRVGDLVSKISSPIKTVKKIKVELNLFEISKPLLVGTPFVLFRNNCQVPARITELQEIIGSKKKKKLLHIISKQTAIVVIEIEKTSLSLTKFDDNELLGRIVIRREGSTIGAGKVIDLIDE